MKGFEIKRDNEIVYLYNKNDLIDFAANVLYYTANPESKMSVPNAAYLKAEKMFESWSKEGD